MREVLLTSSVLILALLVLRLLFRRTISRRVQYALWLLVAVRLLVPVNLPAADFSVLTAAEPVAQAVTARLEGRAEIQQEVYIPVSREPLEEHPQAPDTSPSQAISPSDSQIWVIENDETAVQYRKLTLENLMHWIWYTGIAGMLAWMLLSNLRFWRMLRRERTPYEVEECLYPVYLVADGLPSPCLFGLVSPAIYLTPAAMETPERLRHVIAHESAHARHYDHLWALLRSLCLALYWFDPLVWAAAAASKADGELACDESALGQLGDAERIPYGRTLLALIPVRSHVPAPLLSATTMTAGKRQLKDRVMRIAQNRRTVTAALFAVIALAAGICAVTFTGAKAEDEARPLTGDELAYFNEEFFNQDGGACMPNEFLSFLFTSPEEIQVSTLFSNGLGMTDQVPDAEWQQLEVRIGSRSQLFWGCRKITAADMDALLMEYTGRTAADMAPETLESFVYLPEQDAYYSFYPLEVEPSWSLVQFSAGEREDRLIRLYYQDFSFGGYGTLCVTLEEQPDGSYWFVSHTFAENAAIPTVYPEGDPWLTIPLTDLAPYEPERPPVVRHTDDRTEEYLLTDVYDDSYVLYRSTDGNLYAAVENEIVSDENGIVTWDVGCFFTFPDGTEFSDVTVTDFYDLLGQNGMAFSYYGEQGEYTSSLITDYWYLDADGVPRLLARAHGGTAVADLDGNGENELLSDQNQLFFQREGSLYAADITALLEANWPEMTWWDYSLTDTNRRCLIITGFARATGTPADSQSQFSFIRYCYFDGENLLFYQDITSYTDHVADNVDAPDYALEAARDRVLADLAGWQARSDTAAGWDDWRITTLSRSDVGETYTALGLEVYFFNYELHSPTPEQVMSAGGMYVREDGWVGGFYVESPFVVFLRQADGTYTQLESTIPSDVGRDAQSPLFLAAVAQMAMENGLLTPDQIDAETLLDLFCSNGISFLNGLGNLPETEQSAAVEALASFHNQGLFEEEGSLRHTMQNIAWSQRSLTEGGAAVWRALLDRTGISPGGIGGSYDDLDEAILNAILDHRASVSGRTDDFYAAAYDVLDTRRSGNTCTVYLYICFGSYDRTGDGYALRTGGEDPAALTFATHNDLYQLTEYWTPLGGSQYAKDLRTVFPAEAAEHVLSRDGWDDLTTRRDAMAAQQYASLTASAPQDSQTPAFTAADVEFTDQPLEMETDFMTYEERLAWAKDTTLPASGSLVSTGTYREEAGCLAILGQWVGTSHVDQYYLMLRFPDGALARLPLPMSNPVNVAPPDTMGFSGGTFVYTVSFSEDVVSLDGESPLHIKGTYRYTVDLAAKTASLTVTNP